MTPPAPAAVLWDMDGTIVDTEPYWMQAEISLIESHGGRWTIADGLTLVGQGLLTSAEMIVQRTGIPMLASDVVSHLIGEVVERVSEGAPWRPGAVGLISALSTRRIPMALVTMSYASLADAVIAQLPPNTFATVVTGDQVTHGKPHPEPYLRATAALGVDPLGCVAIEDSPAGLASAEAAGCRTLGVRGHVDIAARIGRSRLATLAGVSVEDLARIAAGEVLDLL